MYKITRNDNSVFFFSSECGLNAAAVSDRIKKFGYAEADYTKITVTPC